jgi:gamma-F420-2:alpha-L-glutamate ligase
MRAWLIYPAEEIERNRRCIGFYFEECEKRGIELALLTAQDLAPCCGEQGLYLIYKEQMLTPPDFAVFRCVDPVLQRHIERMGVPVFNSSAVSTVCNHKMLTTQLVASLGIPVMETRYFAAPPEAPAMLYPFVLKPVDGHGGKNVCFARKEEEYRQAAAVLAGKPCLMQAASSDLGRDVRVYVIGHSIRAAMLRISENDFRSNFCLGGHAKRYLLSDGEWQMVQKLADSMDFGFVGIDFIFHHGKMVFNEIEDVVGARMLYMNTDINIVGEYLDFILARLKKAQESR